MPARTAPGPLIPWSAISPLSVCPNSAIFIAPPKCTDDARRRRGKPSKVYSPYATTDEAFGQTDTKACDEAFGQTDKTATDKTATDKTATFGNAGCGMTDAVTDVMNAYCAAVAMFAASTAAAEAEAAAAAAYACALAAF